MEIVNHKPIAATSPAVVCAWERRNAVGRLPGLGDTRQNNSSPALRSQKLVKPTLTMSSVRQTKRGSNNRKGRRHKAPPNEAALPCLDSLDDIGMRPDSLEDIGIRCTLKRDTTHGQIHSGIPVPTPYTSSAVYYTSTTLIV